MEGICVNFLDQVQFFSISQGTLPWQPIKLKNRCFTRTNIFCRTAIPKRIAISQFWFQKVQWNAYICIVHNFGYIRTSNPRVYAVNNNTFCDDTAKIGISRQISHNILDLSWPNLQDWFGSRIDEDDYPDIRLVVSQETLLWQPVKFGRCSQTSHRMTFTLCFGVQQRINQQKSATKRFNGSNPATSCTNLVNFCSLISKFTLLKRSIFTAMHPQFDDDLHSSRWRFQTNSNVAILISAE